MIFPILNACLTTNKLFSNQEVLIISYNYHIIAQLYILNSYLPAQYLAYLFHNVFYFCGSPVTQHNPKTLKSVACIRLMLML